jgi:hypothetical protein
MQAICQTKNLSWCSSFWLRTGHTSNPHSRRPIHLARQRTVGASCQRPGHAGVRGGRKSCGTDRRRRRQPGGRQDHRSRRESGYDVAKATRGPQTASSRSTRWACLGTSPVRALTLKYVCRGVTEERTAPLPLPLALPHRIESGSARLATAIYVRPASKWAIAFTAAFCNAVPSRSETAGPLNLSGHDRRTQDIRPVCRQRRRHPSAHSTLCRYRGTCDK